MVGDGTLLAGLEEELEDGVEVLPLPAPLLLPAVALLLLPPAVEEEEEEDGELAGRLKEEKLMRIFSLMTSMRKYWNSIMSFKLKFCKIF